MHYFNFFVLLLIYTLYIFIKLVSLILHLLTQSLQLPTLQIDLTISFSLGTHEVKAKYHR